MSTNSGLEDAPLGEECRPTYGLKTPACELKPAGLGLVAAVFAPVPVLKAWAEDGEALGMG